MMQRHNNSKMCTKGAKNSLGSAPIQSLNLRYTWAFLYCLDLWFLN